MALLLASCKNSNDSTQEPQGIIEGTVTIGPFCPVEREDVECKVPPEAYAARKILIYDQDGTRLLKELNIGPDGNFTGRLDPGWYVVDITRAGIDSSPDVPAYVRIRPSATSFMDISIDTGIR